MTIELSAQLK